MKTSQICDGFYKYFRDLAIPKNDPLFDTEHKNNVEFDYLLIEEITKNEQIESEKFIITIKDAENAINGLNKGKSPDILGITAEHIQYGGDITVQYIFNILEYKQARPR